MTVVRCLLLALFPLSGLCAAQDAPLKWGTVKGQIVLDGKPEAVSRLEVERDKEFCGKHDLKDESLLVNPKNGGVQNVVIWLSSRRDVPVHPDLKALPKPAKLDNRDCGFHPRIVRLRCNQTLQAINSDPVAHNVAVYGRRNQPFSIVVPGDMPLERSFAREEVAPIRVDCSIHPWMNAYLIITEHPYSVVTDKDGRFEICNVPQGEWEFKLWHERPGYLRTVEGREKQELKRGLLKVDVSEQTDLGTLKVPVADFAADE